MNLIFLYGPPASGKLTVAEKLSEITGIPLFHNHLSRDIVKHLYGSKLRDHYELVDKIRYEIFDYCSKNNTDIIFTYVYEGSEDDQNIKDFINIIENNNGKVNFIELTADRQDLIDRVSNESRTRYKKLTDPIKMKEITEDMSIYSMPFVDAIKINTSKLSPEEAVSIIIDSFKIQVGNH